MQEGIIILLFYINHIYDEIKLFHQLPQGQLGLQVVPQGLPGYLVRAVKVLTTLSDRMYGLDLVKPGQSEINISCNTELINTTFITSIIWTLSINLVTK